MFAHANHLFIIAFGFLWANSAGLITCANASADAAPTQDDAVAKKVSTILDDMANSRNLTQMADKAKPIKQLGKKAVPALLQALKEAKNEQRRLCVLLAIGELGEEAREAAPALWSVVKDNQESFLVRNSAMGSLRSLAPNWKDHLDFLVDSLNDVVIAKQAKEVLEELGPSARAVVPKLLKLSETRGVRARADYFEILAAIGPGAKEAVPMLLNTLKNSKVTRQRREALLALGSIGPQTEEVVPALLRALRDEDWEIRCAGADALTRLGPVNDRIVPALRRALQDDSKPVSESALRSLGLMGKKAEAAIPDILAIYRSAKPYALIRPVAIQALGRIEISSPEVLDALKAARKDPDPHVRIAAVRSLMLLFETAETEVQLLAEIVNDAGVGKELTRAEAMQVLGNMGSKAKSAVPALLKALQDDYSYIRKVAAEQLQRIDPEAASKAGMK